MDVWCVNGPCTPIGMSNQDQFIKVFERYREVPVGKIWD